MLNKIIIHCDGAARGNPGRASIGIVIFDEKMNIIKKYKKYLGITTNNVAEYNALINSLKLAKEFCKKEIEIYMDSELAVRQMNGVYKVRDKKLQKLFSEAKEYEKEFAKIIYKNIPRENKYQILADELANEALDE